MVPVQAVQWRNIVSFDDEDVVVEMGSRVSSLGLLLLAVAGDVWKMDVDEPCWEDIRMGVSSCECLFGFG